MSYGVDGHARAAAMTDLITPIQVPPASLSISGSPSSPSHQQHSNLGLLAPSSGDHDHGLLSHARTGRVFQIPDAVDVSTTSAFDFDVDAASGFMPPLPPTIVLPSPAFDAWEHNLTRACSLRLRPADAVDITEDDRAVSESWRTAIRSMPTIPTHPIEHSETLLRRAHHVLTFLLSFYAHSHPRPLPNDPPAPLKIPASIAVPLSTVSRAIGIAPVVTYADTVLWNWAHVDESYGSRPIVSAGPNLNVLATATAPGCPATATASATASPSMSMNPLAMFAPSCPGSSPSSKTPALEDLRTLTLFTGLGSEAHFYLTSARIELASARALAHMERTLDELFLSDALAVRRIAHHLSGLAVVIDEMTALLSTMRSGCDPDEFYRDIRPWFVGGEAWPGGMGWEFEGVEDETARERARFTNGASAGQSSIIHALDIFLGTPNTHSPYLHKMEYHMPRHHRAFLRHLRSRPIESTLSHLLATSPLATDPVKSAFNSAVLALKRFRDTHIRIAVLYIVTQARKNGNNADEAYGSPLVVPGGDTGVVKGTGGTDLVPFLKNLRDNTARTVVPLLGDGTPARRGGCPF